MSKVKIIDRRRGKNRSREEQEEAGPRAVPSRPLVTSTMEYIPPVQVQHTTAKDRPSMAERIKWIQDNLEQMVPDYITVIGDDPDDNFGTVIIPDASKARPTSGTIVLAGPDCPKECQPGCRIIYTEFSGCSMDLKNWNVRAMRWSEAPWRIKKGRKVRLAGGRN